MAHENTTMEDDLAFVAMPEMKRDDILEEIKDSTQDRVEGIHSKDWLESPFAKILALIAFGILAAILFWQGLKKQPVEPPGLAPQSSGPDTRVQDLGHDVHVQK